MSDTMDGTNTSALGSHEQPKNNDSREQATATHAPAYKIPRRRFGAVEHPMIVKNIDNGVSTFGRGHAFQSILDSANPQISVPLYFRPDNPTVRPLTSHNAATHNVLVKVTLPKRTGRKRKRGTDGPFLDDATARGLETRLSHDGAGGQCIRNSFQSVDSSERRDGSGSSYPLHAAELAQRSSRCVSQEAPPSDTLMSQSGLDKPAVLRRKLQDNVGKYTVEPVGIVHNTHRYRGLSDFQYSMSDSRFMNSFVGTVMPGSIPKLRQFTIETGTAQPPNIDLIPPPFFAPHGMPNVYNYSQNPFVRGNDSTQVPTYDNPPPVIGHPSSSSDLDSDSDASDDSAEFNKVVNTSMRGTAPGYFIRYNDFPAPLRPRMPPDTTDPHVKAVMAELYAAMEERPAWTRRSMFNRLSSAVSSLPKSGNIIKHCIQYAGYQFRGGPWRDSLVKYGVDPRTDPKYRVYQTLIFKLHKRRVGNVGGSWQSVRRKEVSTLSGSFGRYWKEVDDGVDRSEAHKFDGTSFSTDGKVWQVCDISDPLLKRLFDEAVPLPECDFEKSGWYSPVLWCVAKAIMKRKMLAIRFRRDIPDEAYHEALEIVRKAADGKLEDIDKLTVPLPPLHLSPEEREQIRGRRVKTGRKGRERDKNKNAPLRIRHIGSGPKEVRIVHYPGDDRRLEDMSYPASVVDSSRMASPAVLRDKEAIDDAADEPETLEELLESDEDDQDDDEDDDDEDDDEGEGADEDEDDEDDADPDEDDEDEDEEEDEVQGADEFEDEYGEGEEYDDEDDGTAGMDYGEEGDARAISLGY